MTDLSLFDYQLPERLIAQRPAERRDESRLMKIDRRSGQVSHHTFPEFPSMLRRGDALVINNTRVFPARLYAEKPTGGRVEILLVKQKAPGIWEAMARGLKKISPGDELFVGAETVTLIEKLDNGAAVFRFRPGVDVLSLADRHGDVPLPPYIERPNGKADTDDVTRYQTLFARHSGSCAAPTAGLHFSDDILAAIKDIGVNVTEVTLHVGPGTFRPVKSDNINDHRMDAEPYEISEETADTVNRAISSGGRVVAVGSTATRTLESMGESGRLRSGRGETSLFIKPGYEFKIVNAMLTNFHLPKSTLLILVCAFAGRDVALRAYAEAVEREYRFFSYGDAMFIE